MASTVLDIVEEDCMLFDLEQACPLAFRTAGRIDGLVSPVRMALRIAGEVLALPAMAAVPHARQLRMQTPGWVQVLLLS